MRKLHKLVILIASISLLNSFQALGQTDPCDVNLIEVAVVDITGLNGQPDFDNAHICSVADTVRIELGSVIVTLEVDAAITAATSLVNIAEITSSENIDGDIQSDIDSTPDDVQGNEDGQVDYYIDDDLKDQTILQKAVVDQKFHNTFHLFSHGQSGELLIRGVWKDHIQIKNWIVENNFPIRNKQLNIYGCNFAEGEKGQQAVSYLETALGVSIAASDDLTGRNGDWDLEVGSVFQHIQIDNYNYNLGLPSLWDDLKSWAGTFFEADEENQTQAISMMMTCGGVVGGTAPTDDFDGDGNCNDVDIDDDNDGILDVDEGCVPMPYDMTDLTWTGDAGMSVSATSTTLTGGSSNWKSALSDQVFTLPLDVSFTYTVATGLTMFGFAPEGSALNNNWTINSAYGFYIRGTRTDARTGITTAFLQNNTTVKPHRITIDAAGNLTLYIDGVIVYTEAGLPTDNYQFYISNFNSPNKPFEDISFAENGSPTISLLDSDEDGIPNCFDLDSDGDGCYDSYEAGVTGATNDGSVTDSLAATTNAEVGMNGYANSLETAEDGVATFTSTYTPYALRDDIDGCVDTDGDGIRDVADLDDDNDGILDTDEDLMACSSYSTIDITSGAGGAVLGSTTLNYTISTTGTSQTIGGTEDFGGYTWDNRFLWQRPDDAYTVTTITFSQPVNRIVVFVSDNADDDPGYVEVIGTQARIITTNNAAGVNVSASGDRVTSNRNTYKSIVEFVDLNGRTEWNVGWYNDLRSGTSSTGDDRGAIAICTEALAIGDADDDGIVNSLDPDSDNDGCPDAIEGGGSFTSTDVIAAGGTLTDGNGNVANTNLGNTVDMDPASAAYGVPTTAGAGQAVGTSQLADVQSAECPVSCGMVDTDGDGVFDLCDLDDDNDGILDTDEGCEIVNTDMRALTWTGDATMSVSATDGTTLVGASTSGWKTSLSDQVFTLPLEVSFTYTVAAGNTMFGFAPEGSALNDNWNIDSAYGFYIAGTSSYRRTGTAIVIEQNSTLGLTHRITIDAAGNFTLYIDGVIVYTEAGLPTDNYQFYVSTRDSPDKPIEDISFAANGNPAICLLDTDDDGIPNGLDLDSDGDGCYDSYEAAVTGATNDGSLTDSLAATTNAEVGINGYANSLETTEDGVPTYTSSYNPYALRDDINACADTDGDGIADVDDLDDDNDGILDIDEDIMACSSFGTIDITGSGGNVILGSTTVNYTISNTGTPDLLGGSENYDGIAWDNRFRWQQPFDDYEVTTITFSQPVNRLVVFVGDMADDDPGYVEVVGTQARILSAAGPTVPGGVYVSASGDRVYSTHLGNKAILEFIDTYGRTEWNIGWNNDQRNTNSNTGTDYGAYAICEAALGVVDTDNDGIINSLDTDSDNDGCPDAIEGGGIFTATDVTTAGGTLTDGNGDGANTNLGNTVDTDPASASYGVPTTAGAGQTVGNSQNANNDGCLDADGDGIADIDDLDDDNDGILDTDEEDCPDFSNISGGSGMYPDEYYIINWDDPVFDDGIQDGDSKNIPLPNGTTLTATFSNAVNLSGNTNITDLNTWSGAAAHKLYQTAGTKEAIYNVSGQTFSGTVSFSVTPDACGKVLPLNFVAIDAEATGGSERVVFTTNGAPWVPSETVGSGATYILSNNDQTVTYTNTINNYTLLSSYDATQIDFSVPVTAGGQGVAFGFRYQVCFTDTDGDCIINSLDTDSDNDGCPDAIEGGGSFTITDVTTAGGTLTDGNGDGANTNLGNTVDTDPASASYGVPTTAGAGQTVGDSQDADVQSADCPVDCGMVDTDGDGVFDLCDLDDDNDGILDVDECPSSALATNALTFPTGSLPGGITYSYSGNTANVSEYSPGDIYVSGADPGVTITFSQPVTVTITNPENQPPATLTGGQTILSWGPRIIEFTANTGTWDFVPGTFTGFTPCINGSVLTREPNDGCTIGGNFNATDDWGTATIEGITTLTFTGDNREAYRFLVSPVGDCPDTDDDGIVDSLDTDSDNDGCPDAIEGGGSFTLTDVTTAGGTLTDGNGDGANTNLGNTVDTDPASASYGVPTTAGAGQTVGDSQDAAVQSADCTLLENTITLCTDGIDNDNDGVSDCDDPNCAVFNLDQFTNADFAYWNLTNNYSGTFSDGTNWTYSAVLNSNGGGANNIQTPFDNVANFPTEYQLMPNAAAFERVFEVSEAATVTVTFDQPITNPYILIGELGDNGADHRAIFGEPVEVFWSENITIDSPTQVTGNNGNIIVKYTGTHSSVSVNFIDGRVNNTNGLSFTVLNGPYCFDPTPVSLEPCDDASLTAADICAAITADPTSPMASADCDGDGETNAMECTNGTDPTDPCSNSYATGTDICTAITAGATDLGTADCDGAGEDNATECANGTDPTNPCDDAGLTAADICAAITADPTSVMASADCDGDGELNETECTNGTDPFDPCSNSYADGAAVCSAIANGATGFAAVDCDGGGVSDAQECADGTDPLDPCDDAGLTGADICADIAANGNMSIYTGLDCDGDGVSNDMECADGTDPSDPCSNSYTDGAAICAAITNGATGFAAADCDGGGVSDAQECADGTDPLDPCDDTGLTGADICADIAANGMSSPFMGQDCDGDGELNETECTNGTDPTDPCSNSYADGAAVCAAIANGATGFSAVDCDGGGVSDAQECADGTDPLDPCDDAGVTGADICADIAANGNMSIYSGLDCDGDGVFNDMECADGTDPSDPCSNSYADAAAVCAAIANGADGFDNVDCDGGGVSDAQECADGTDPLDPCDDMGLTGIDICADLSLNGTASVFSGLDCDGDGQYNDAECANGTDPLDPCSNSYPDGTSVCAAIANGATGFAGQDCDGGGVTDIEECANGTDPTNPMDDCAALPNGMTSICELLDSDPTNPIGVEDCDGDGQSNTEECNNGTDPTDPCSNSYANGTELCAAISNGATAFANVDCDGGGVSDAQECADGTDPMDPCDDMGLTSSYVCADIVINGSMSPFFGADCDGGGVNDEDECADGTDPMDPCDDTGLTGSDICADITANGVNSPFMGIDCDGDGENNEEECTNGTDPLDPCSNSYADAAALCTAIANGADGFDNVDCDGGGVSDAQECADGTDPMDPCDDAGLTGSDICADITTNGVNSPFMGIDCDGDGENNEEECTNGTDPSDPCSNSYADAAALCTAIANGADGFDNVDCDGGGVSDAQECADGTDPTDPCDDTGLTGGDICADIVANGALSQFVGIDCDGDGENNEEECTNGTDPLDPCSNSYADGAAVCTAITNGATGFAAVDCDGGGVSDAQECADGTDPLDPCDDAGVTGADICADIAANGNMSIYSGLDCDGDGVFNDMECADGTDPMDPCDDAGLTGSDICADITTNGVNSPFMGIDCDGDGENNEEECTNGTDPLDPCSNSYADGAAVCAAIANGATGFAAADCDGGGVSDAQECADGTDPLDPCDDTGLTGADICADIAANGMSSPFMGQDCDDDGELNETECTNGTDPTDPCSNSYADGAAVCAAITNGATGFAAVDCDGGGVSDAQECADGTDPLDPCDDAGVTGADICADIAANGNMSIYSGLDCDGDGVFNDMECADGTDPSDPCSNSYADAAAVCAAIANGADGFDNVDCDGGGVSDAQECADGTDPLDPCDDMGLTGIDICADLSLNGTASVFSGLDCDGDGQYNDAECANGTDPLDPCSNSYPDGTSVCAAIANGATGFAGQDCDGGGVTDIEECANGTDPTNPMDDCAALPNGMTSICELLDSDPTNPIGVEDCDGDGQSNTEECNNGTDPTDPCSNNYSNGTELCAAISNGATAFANVDCDGGGVSDAQECADGTDPMDPCDDMGLTSSYVCADIVINGSMSPFFGADCDGGGVNDEDECADGTDPMDPCDDAGLTGSDICASITTEGSSSPFMGIDCDGDGENNEEECMNGTDPLDPCSNSYADAAALCTAIANGADGFDNVDCDGGGVSDAQECADGTDPMDPCDDAGLTGSDICADITTNGVNSPFMGIDCDGDGENNEEECTNGTDPSDPCSNSYADAAALCTAIANGADGFDNVDCDGGGVSDAQECADGTDPTDPCDDTGLTGGDICADIVANGALSQFVGIDCDGDGENNEEECTNGTDPLDPCSNSYADGAAVCTAITNGATGFAAVDCDGGGVSDAQECADGTDPLDPCDDAGVTGADICADIAANGNMSIYSGLDCDGDGVFNDMECADGTDPMDPCDDAGLTGSDICADITTNGVNSPFMGIDCDGDGENNEEECTNGTDPLDPCSNSYADGAAVCAAIANGATGFAAADCDGGGVSDAQECADGTDPLDPCDDTGLTGADICADIAANGMSSPFMGQDCDDDGELNETECTNGTDPTDPCSNSYADGAAVCAAITNGATGFAAVDCDGGGVSDAQECTDGTDPLDPCDDAGVTGATICAFITIEGSSSVFYGLDCDGDGELNEEECINGTDPSDPCSNSYADAAALCTAIANGADGFDNVDCDGGGVSDAQECADGTDPMDPCDDAGLTGSDICADITTNGVNSPFMGIDCDGDGENNEEECMNGTDPLDPCSNSYADAAALCTAIANGADGFDNVDCDGGGVSDAQECADGTDPMDPCDDAGLTGSDICADITTNGVNSPFMGIDCDGDGENNEEECTNGTDPLDPCSNSYADAAALCTAIANGADGFDNVDCDGGGVSDAQECADGTDPTDPCDDTGLTGGDICADIVANGALSQFVGIDCDGDGENNEEECTNGTDPLDPCSNSYTDGAAVCTAITNGATGFAAVDCDGGGVSDAQECADGTDPLDPCDDAGLTGSDICADIAANGNMSIYSGLDCDGDGVFNDMECADGTDPSDPCDPGFATGEDLCAAMAESPTLGDLDCDGDGETNAEECENGTDPTDPCDHSYETGAEMCAYILANPDSPLALADCDQGGVDNLTECDNGGDPLDDNDDCDAILNDIVDVCALLISDPTNPLATSDCDGDGKTNAEECEEGTDPTDPCDPGDLTAEEMCALIAANPESPLAYADCDEGGVANNIECENGDDPTDPSDDTDPCDEVFETGEELCAAIETNPGLGLADCDEGGIDNATECENGGDPTDPSDDCDQVQNGEVDVCALILKDKGNTMGEMDCDGDGKTNAEECEDGTDPTDPCDPGFETGEELCAAIASNPELGELDCDGDGVNNAKECEEGTDPNDPCDYPEGEGVDLCELIAENPYGELAMADCDGGGVPNGIECENGEDPEDPSDDCELVNQGAVDVCEILSKDPTNPMAEQDCDGDGKTNAEECEDGTDPTDPCDPGEWTAEELCALIEANPKSPLAYADCDEGGVANNIECEEGTDPTDPSDDKDPCEEEFETGEELCAAIETNPALGLADCDNGGVDNATECENGGDPLDPSDDCDLVNEGIVDVCELIANDPMNPFNLMDCDGDGLDNIVECENGTDPTDPCDPGVYDSGEICAMVLAEPNGLLASSDCDYGGVDNITECENGGDPSDPSDDCDLVLDQIIDVCKILDEDPENTVATMDCDEDGSTNAEECEEGTDPTDPCDNLFESGEEMCAFILANPTSSLALADCDEGGINNLIECMNGTDPLDPDDDCEAALSEGIDLCQFLEENPDSPMAGKDCDEGGIDNKTECEFVGTFGFNPNPADPADDCDFVIQGIVDVCALLDADPANPLGADDCDGDGISNLDECIAMTDPTDPCDPGTFTSEELCALVMADPTSPLAFADCDNGGITNIIECELGDNPLDPSDDCKEIVCIGDINLSLDNTCSSEITPEMLLSVVSYSIEMYEIELKDEYGNVVDNNFDYTDIGKCFTFSVSVPVCNGQSCWGNVCVEDKFIPSIDCGLPITLPCNATEGDYPDPIVTDNCGGAELVMVNQTITPAECQDHLRVIERTFIAVDAQGNESAPCTQTLIIDRVDLSGIQFPVNYSSDVCTASTDPLSTGVPTFMGQAIYPEVPGELCNVFVTYEDIPLGSGDCNLSFMRMWQVGEWYCGTTAGPMTFPQMIEVNDLTPPSVSCPGDLTVTTDGGAGLCEATVMLPAAEVSDDCNNPVEVNIIGGAEVLFTNGGAVKLPVGTTTLTYVAYDGCYNSSTCEMTVTVADNTQPTVVCKLNTVVSLQSTGLSEVYAEVFDNGSFDDCEITTFEAARMDDVCNVSGTDFGPSVTFCCADVGTEVMVRLRVTDSSGNYNVCMVVVEVQDKEAATLSCPADETVECGTPYDINNLETQFGTYSVEDNCVNQTVTESVEENIDQCGLGTVTRTFTMPDGQGGTLSCSQVITFMNADPFDGNDPNNLIWPLDITLDGMCSVDDVHPDDLGAAYSYPIITEDACDLVGANFEDQVFSFVQGEDACFKVLRRWSVIDWCQRNDDGTFVTFQHEQVIKVTNTVSPTLDSGCEDQVIETLDCDAAFVTLQIAGSDDCTSDAGLSYSYSVERLNDGVLVDAGNTNDASRTYELGIYEISWIVLDGCGNEVSCSSTFEVKSNKSPVAYCIQGLSTDLLMMDTDGDGLPDTEMIELWANDFDAGSYHPCGYAVTLSFSSDPTDTNITFDCSQQGQQGVQLWVTDENGNQTFCNTYVIVEDNDNSCPEMLIVDVQGRIFTEVNKNVEDVEVVLDGSADQDMTSEVGEYVFEDMPIGGAYVIDPGKNDDVMNGVSTLDLVMIQKHLLQLRELDSPYKLIAADINHDEKVTAIDLIQLRKLILGVVEEFPANTSWRFVDALYEFPIPTNPWDEAFPEEYDIPALNTNMSIDFVGVKIGDVNGSVTANITGDITENRSDKSLHLVYTDRVVQEGEQVIVPLRSSNFEQIAGLQLTLDHKGLILDRVEEGVLEMNSGNIGKLQDAQTTLSWNDRGGIQQTTKSADVLFNLVFTASETGRLSTMLSLSDQVIQTEAYRLLATTEFEEINISLEVEISKTDIIEGYTLHQNEPNPWSRMTAISIESIKDVEGTLTVKDALGKLIVSKDVALVTGLNELVLTKDDIPVGGVYYYTLTMGDVQLSKQMIRME